jgi:hypothetical protein
MHEIGFKPTLHQRVMHACAQAHLYMCLLDNAHCACAPLLPSWIWFPSRCLTRQLPPAQSASASQREDYQSLGARLLYSDANGAIFTQFLSSASCIKTARDQTTLWHVPRKSPRSSGRRCLHSLSHTCVCVGGMQCHMCHWPTCNTCNLASDSDTRVRSSESSLSLLQ